jgi:hypothetical protein
VEESWQREDGAPTAPELDSGLGQLDLLLQEIRGDLHN